MNEERDSLVLLLLREGSVEEAVRAHQEDTGLSHYDAKRAVLTMAARNGVPSRGFAPWAVALLAAATLVGFLLSH